MMDMNGLTDLRSVCGDAFPITIKFDETLTVYKFVKWYVRNREEIDAMLLDKGALLLKNIEIRERADFNAIVSGIGEKPMAYMDGTTPRTNLGENVYTSTEYDANQIIHLHNELSYSAQWPSRIMFCCLMAAESGGATSIADSRRFLKEVDPVLLDALRAKGLRYVRILSDGLQGGQSWQKAFQCSDRATAESYCREAGMEYHWYPDGSLRITHSHPGIIRHPQTGEEVWFNQMDQFHPLHLGREIYEMLLLMYGGTERLPLYVTFGDGSEIREEWIQNVMDTGQRIAVNNSWQAGDLLLLDNVLTCHGRQPYCGERKILVSMF
ncbi:TauD/TfdA family dioxygenase [Chitinophaga oryzae]|uniref:TauD/TfdA family dioxygenase n=1 Tax=Chitinophaga oryzae TaxID=2725414 RepID=A0AAE7D6A3_9BACT|nr:TauD/TfdA family dioxygenase [Chitinophaga oryzae]QJB30477.1 TauD/TfdA family dioxygenase [Chitinophaga oryzae]